MGWRHHDLRMRMPDNRDLIAMAMSDVAADREFAFELIFLRYGEAVLRMCGSMLDRDRAVDAAQESFARALRKLRDNNPPSNPDKLEGWLIVIAKNVVREQYRPGRQVPVPEISAAHDDPAEHARTEASRIADEQRRRGRRAEVLRILDIVVATLTPAQRHIYDLTVREELVGRQLAARLDISPAQASRQANEVRNLVRDGFGSYVLALWALHTWRVQRAETCQGLGSVLVRHGWNGNTFTTKLRQDIHQHVLACGTCREQRDHRLHHYAPALFPLLFLPQLADRMRQTIRLVSAETPLVPTAPTAGRTPRSATARRRPPGRSPRRARRGRRRAAQTAGVIVTGAALMVALFLFGDILTRTTSLAGGQHHETTSQPDPKVPHSGPASSPSGTPASALPPGAITTSPVGSTTPRTRTSPGTLTSPGATPGPDDTPEPLQVPDETTVTVPDVLDEDYDLAAATLQDEGLVPTRIDEESDLPADTTLEQSPDPGAVVQTGSTVTVTVSIGEQRQVPDVVGDSRTTARAQLTDAGFEINEVGFTDGACCRVSAQTPAAGTIAAKGTVVTITLEEYPYTATH